MRALFLITAALIGFTIPVAAEEVKAPLLLESLGTMSDIASGAYEKTMWQGNKRSEILEAIKNLPPESALRSLHDMKRRALLSKTDSSLIKSDVDPAGENSLFLARLNKLQDMGLYEDALKLYTDNVDTPDNARLAQTGLILMIHQRGLATACLEEQVIAPDFEGDEFFTLMDSICAFELGQTDTPPKIEQSKLLETTLADEALKYSALDKVTYAKLSPLELAILKSEERIDYATFDTTPGALRGYASRVLMTFFQDKTLPELALVPLQIELARRGYVPVKKLPAAKNAKQLGVDVNDQKKTDQKAADKMFWAAMSPLLKGENEIVNLTPYGSLMKEADPSVSGADFYKALAVLLASGNNIPDAWCAKLAAQKTPESGVYYESLVFLRACEAGSEKPVDTLETMEADFPPEKHGNLWVIMGLLAPDTPEYANFKSAYEKHFSLTLHEDYVMHNEQDDAEGAKKLASQGFGLNLIRILSAAKSETGENINPPVLQITVKSLLDEGLDADARQLAKEVFVGLLLKQK